MCGQVPGSRATLTPDVLACGGGALAWGGGALARTTLGVRGHSPFSLLSGGRREPVTSLSQDSVPLFGYTTCLLSKP